MQNRRILWFVLAIGLTGCEKPLNVVPVEGVVRLDGKPLPGVEVRYFPEVGEGDRTPPPSFDLTDGNGHYTLKCDNGKPGAVVASHRVMIRRPSTRPGPGDPKPPSGPPVPMIYQSLADSPLRVNVVAEQSVYDLKLKSPGQ